MSAGGFGFKPGMKMMRGCIDALAPGTDRTAAV
jgi:hypothetical protein